MQILVADRDRRFLELIRTVVEGEGHKVTIAEDGRRALSLLGDRPPDLLVLELELQHPAGAEVLRSLRGQREGGRTYVVLTTAGASSRDAAVYELVRECQVDQLLRKPFPMFDLVDLLRDLELELAGQEEPAAQDPVDGLSGLFGRPALEPTPLSRARLSQVTLPTAPGYSTSPVDPGNLRRIAALWARRRSGTLRLEQGPGGAHGWMVLGQGGPMDSDGWELISAALHGGTLQFEAHAETDAAGDHLGLGAMLFGRVREPDDDGFVDRHRFDALVRLQAEDALAAIPCSEDARRLLSQRDPSRTLGELCTELGLDPQVLGADLCALELMGLVQLGRPVVRTGDARGPGSRSSAARSSHSRSGTGRFGHGRDARAPRDSIPARLARTRAAREDGLSRSTPGEHDQAEEDSITHVGPPSRSVGPSTTGTGPASDPTAIDPRIGAPSGSSEPRSEPAHWARIRRRMAHRGREWTTRQLARQSSRQRHRVLRRLRKERERLLTADPAVVLGLPPDAPDVMVEQAIARMTARYEELAGDTQQTVEARELAHEILVLVHKARAAWVQEGSLTSKPPEERSPVDQAIELGRQAISAGDWGRALRVLRRGRDLDLGHPTMLALLGWATLHDDSLSDQEREEDARGLLFLAAELDSRDFDAAFYLGRFLADRGETRAALRMASRALKARPDDVAARALVGRLQKDLQAQQQPG